MKICYAFIPLTRPSSVYWENERNTHTPHCIGVFTYNRNFRFAPSSASGRESIISLYGVCIVSNIRFCAMRQIEIRDKKCISFIYICDRKYAIVISNNK